MPALEAGALPIRDYPETARGSAFIHTSETSHSKDWARSDSLKRLSLPISSIYALLWVKREK